MKEGENEAYLGDIIGNNLSENDTFNKALIGIEKLGQTWLRQIIGIYGRTIVANTLLTAKLSHRPSVNGISKSMKNRIRKKIKDFMWGGENKKAPVRWETMSKHPKEGGTVIKYPITILDAAKTNMLKN